MPSNNCGRFLDVGIYAIGSGFDRHGGISTVGRLVVGLTA